MKAVVEVFIPTSEEFRLDQVFHRSLVLEYILSGQWGLVWTANQNMTLMLYMNLNTDKQRKEPA